MPLLRRALTAMAVTAALAPAGLNAQTASSGYFLEDYTYRYQLNPAMANSRGFVSMPGLGNLNTSMTGNLGLKNVLFYRDGRTVTFMNPSVSRADALGPLRDHNKISLNVRETILATGFKSFGGYNTVSFNVVGGLNMSLPRDLFSLLKEGVANRTYTISDMNASGRAYAEIQLGHSRQINNKLRIGANIKFLIGLADIEADMRSAKLELGTDSWNITSNADLNVALANFSYRHKMNEDSGATYVSGGDWDKFGVSGFGFGVDLGAVYDINKDWQVSAAVVDLGVLSYTNNHLASTNGDRTFQSDKYIFNPDDEADNSFSNEWDRLNGDLSALYQLTDMGPDGSRTAVLHTTINAGVRYTLPVYRKVNFGLLSTTRLQGKYTWSDVRVSANYAPCQVFDFGVNFVGGTYGVGFGWLVNLHCPGFNLYAGMDRLSGMFTKQGIPLSGNTAFSMGINFLLK